MIIAPKSLSASMAVRTWLDDHEIVIKGDRIAYVGPTGS